MNIRYFNSRISKNIGNYSNSGRWSEMVTVELAEFVQGVLTFYNIVLISVVVWVDILVGYKMEWLY